MDVDASGNPLNPGPKGHSRFELELEFVQCLSNPWYLNHLATQKLFDDSAFVAYLDYLQYFTRPEYLKFLRYPAPTLRALELVQQEAFRRDILSPAMVMRMVSEGLLASVGATPEDDVAVLGK
ncbi:MAG: hypothetical protein M1814_002880 [Vezdaea aestivalis]|nr:MAG: hypothetical protein M1814_002880 [Vezdaea aestivalis]